jgi:hypothetical protein
MQPEKKIIKFKTAKDLENSTKLREELTMAMIENKKVKRLVDLFLLVLFLLLITYTTL